MQLLKTSKANCKPIIQMWFLVSIKNVFKSFSAALSINIALNDIYISTTE